MPAFNFLPKDVGGREATDGAGSGADGGAR